MGDRALDGDFGPPPAPVVPERVEPEPGDEVRIVAGRHRGAKGVLNSLVTTPTPSGSSVIVAYVKRPRAGITAVFSHEIERA